MYAKRLPKGVARVLQKTQGMGRILKIAPYAPAFSRRHVFFKYSLFLLDIFHPWTLFK